MIQRKSPSKGHLSEISEVFHHPRTMLIEIHVIVSNERAQKYQLERSSTKFGVDHGVDQPLLIPIETPAQIHNLDLL